MGRKKGQMKTVIAVIAIIVIVVGAYLVLAYPSVIAEKSNTVSGFSSEKVSFNVGFPKGSIQVVFTVQGTAGAYSVDLLNSTGKIVWSIPATAVPASSTTTQSAWISASGNYTVVVGYLASMTYTVKVLAKGPPF
nr:hypothetical protein [Candidatus Njordarchaeum guaymaensis]